MSFLMCPSTTCEIKLKYDHKRSFLNHIREHIQLNTIKLPFHCSQNGCTKTFFDLKIFSNHLNKFHEPNTEKNDLIKNNVPLNDSNIINTDFFSSESDPDFNDNDYLNNEEKNFVKNDTSTVKINLNTKAFDLVNHLRSKNVLSAVLINEIIDLFSDFIFDLVDIIQEEVFEHLEQASSLNKNNLQNIFNQVNKPFAFLSTTYKQQALLEETGFYVAPKSIYLGKREEISTKNEKAVAVQRNITFEYVSVYDTVKKLLENTEFKYELAQYSTIKEKNYYYDQHPIFKSKKNLRILLYYDDLEMCNGLGDVSGVYKGGMFYFTLLNLTRRHYSNLKNIFLVAICHSNDLKTFGYNKILHIIIEDIKKLEKIGIQIDEEVFFGSIAQCLGDNLGIHQIFGIQQRLKNNTR